MMEYVVNGSEPGPLVIGATGTEELIQNVRVIVTTMQLTVPYDREFGVDSSAIDQPIPLAKALLATEVVRAVTQYEPRVNVTQIGFNEDHLTGKLVPIVRFKIAESEVS